MTNRKLKRNIVFEGRCYCQYQAIILEWYMEKFKCSESESLNWYINSGLAEKFEAHHRPNNNLNETIVTKKGESLT